MKLTAIKKKPLFVMGLLAAAIGISGCNSKPLLESDFKIAVIVPLTGSTASTGNEMANSVEMAIEEYNKTVKKGGKKAHVLKLDDKGDSKEGVIAAKKVAQDDSVVGVVAHLNSGVYLPASNTYHQAGLPAVSPAATNPKITKQGFSEIHRICATDDVQGPLAAKFISEKLKAKKVSILHDATQYGEGLALEVQKKLEELGVEVTGFASITPGEADYRGPLTDIARGQKPDVLYFGGLYDEAGKLVRQYRDLGGEAVFMGGDGIFGKDTIDAGGAATEGVIASIPGDQLSNIEKLNEFKAAYEKRFGKEIQNYGPFAYDVAKILLEATGKAEKEGGVNRERVLAALKTTNYDGAVGKTEFDEKGDTKAKAFTFFKVENGDWTAIEVLQP